MKKVKEGFVRIFRAFRHRNYRLYFFGQSISLIGTWMQQVALSWYVYRITNSAFMLGVVAFAGTIPALLLIPVSGVIADRHNRKRILLITQGLSLLQASILAILVTTGHATIVYVIILSCFLGAINAIDGPLRHSFIVNLVDTHENLANAVALNSAMFNAARLVGPSIAGFIIAILGEDACFTLNAVSYLAVIASLAAISYTFVPVKMKKESVMHELSRGLSYVYHSAPIKHLLIHVSLINLFGFSYTTLFPVLVKDILLGDARLLGFIMGGSGFGALVGALYLASRKSVRGLVKGITAVSTMMSVGLIILSFVSNSYLAVIIVAFVGFGFIIIFGSCNSVIQTIVDDRMRGKVMSLYMLSFTGFAPFGSLLLGMFSGFAGARIAILFEGIICLVITGYYILVLPKIIKGVRPIYEKLGIIPVVED